MFNLGQWAWRPGLVSTLATGLAAVAAWWVVPATATDVEVGALPSSVASHMRFPAAFPEGYTLYATEDSPDDLEVHERYANAAALDAARQGRPLGEGAVLLVAFRAARRGPDGVPLRDGAGRFVPGELRSYSGMEWREGWGKAFPQALRNGDWNYALFGADRDALAGQDQRQCLACHKPLAADSHVFTLKALAGAGTPDTARPRQGKIDW